MRIEVLEEVQCCTYCISKHQIRYAHIAIHQKRGAGNRTRISVTGIGGAPINAAGKGFFRNEQGKPAL